MTESRRIRAQLRAAFDGSPWHGPAVWNLIAEIDFLEAGSPSVSEVHSIWELVTHMTYWRRAAIDALAGRSIAGYQPGSAEDWHNPGDESEATWRQAREDFRGTQDELLAALAGLDDSRLDENVPGRDYKLYYLLHGILQHDAYHAGQIALLRKSYSVVPY